MKRILSLIAVLAFASPVGAQTLVTATSGVSFPASPDHSTVVLGFSVVDHYELNIVAQNNLGAIAFTKGLGKPTPDASGIITVKPISEFGGVAPNTAFVAVVDTVGAAGDKVASVSSDPFARLGPPRPAGKPSAVR